MSEHELNILIAYEKCKKSKYYVPIKGTDLSITPDRSTDCTWFYMISKRGKGLIKIVNEGDLVDSICKLI